jgi:phosphatidate phosphatase APP1
MARSRKTSAGDPETKPVVHLAARIEDSLHEFREKRARKRGLTPVVIPYTGYGAPGWTRVLCRVLLAKPGAEDDTRYKKIRGWRSFTSVPVNGVTVTVKIGEDEQTVVTDRGGVVDEVLTSELAPGWHTITLHTEGSTPVEATIFVVDPKVRFGVISDVDDTVMVTALPRPLLAAWNTFVLDEHARRPVPGMGVLYERLLRAHPGAPVMYLSTGAWNVAPTLSRFLSRNLFPPGPLLLTDWGPTHDRWFRSGREHKAQSLVRLAEEFPNIKWLLIGDDGQHDEQLYDSFASAKRPNVDAVAIRQLSNSEAVLAGGRSRAEEHSEKHGIRWIYAPDGAGLADQLGEAGILAPKNQ